MKDAGYEINVLKDYFKAEDLKKAGFTLEEIKSLGHYGVSELEKVENLNPKPEPSSITTPKVYRRFPPSASLQTLGLRSASYGQNIRGLSEATNNVRGLSEANNNLRGNEAGLARGSSVRQPARTPLNHTQKLSRERNNSEQ